jgi:hypothetical protein
MLKPIYIIILSFLFCSCIKEVDGLPDIPQELVLQCYISPSDTVISAVLSKATSFAVTEIPYKELFVKDAKITISNGVLEKQLTFNPKKNFYEFKVSDEFKIEKGKTYALKAIAGNGKVLTSSCTVPVKSVSAGHIEVDKLFRGSDYVDVRLKWPNSPVGYYVLRPYFYYSASQFKDLPTAHTVQFFDGVTGQEDDITSNYFTNNLITNQRKNVIFLYVADVNFYTYSKSVQLNDNNQSDPFAQPVNAKTNVNGGFGCFGAYNVIRVDLEY